MQKENFTYTFTSPATPDAIFAVLEDVRQWWTGLYGETITGASNQLNDEFTFEAGGGMHYSKQKTIGLVPGKTITWQVTDSRLTFLKEVDEWTDTQFSFDVSKDGDKTRVTFTHEGLTPQIECYNQCSAGWKGYLDRLAERLSEG